MKQKKCKECGSVDCKTDHEYIKRRMDTYSDKPNFRLGLMDASDKEGIIIALVRMDEEEGRCCHLEWADAIDLADRIHAKYQKYLRNS